MDPIFQDPIFQIAIDYPIGMVMLYLLNLRWALRQKDILPHSYQDGYKQTKTMTAQQIRDDYHDAERAWNRRHTQPPRTVKEKTVNELEEAVNDLIASQKKLSLLVERRNNLLYQRDRDPKNLTIVNNLASVDCEIRKIEWEIGIKPSYSLTKQNLLREL